MQILQIRNSTAVFLIFAKQNEKKIIEVIVDEESVQLSQKLMAELFGTTRNNITMNLSNIKEYEHHIIGLNVQNLDSGRFYIFEICGMDLRENKTCKSISYTYE